MVPLGFVENGEKVEIIDFIKKDRAMECHLRDMGLNTGKIIEVLNNQMQGPVLLKIDESRIAIGRGMAMKIMVRRVNEIK